MSDAPLESALFVGRMEHRRHEPKTHRFGYRLWMAWIALEEIDRLGSVSKLLSVEKRGVLSFRRADYLGDPSTPLEDAVRDTVQQELGRRPSGPIRMLTQLRCFGYCFNPVTFYYLYRDDGSLDALAAQITNTPWGERRTYVLDAAQAPEDASSFHFEFSKDFHVSPFFGMDHEYAWDFSPIGESLGVHMTNFRGGAKVFDASLGMKRLPFTAGSLRRVLLRHPFMTGKVIFAIHLQAALLWLKRVPVHAHPRVLAARAHREQAQRDAS